MKCIKKTCVTLIKSDFLVDKIYVSIIIPYHPIATAF